MTAGFAFRCSVFCLASALGASPLLASPSDRPTATFQVQQPSAIPGRTLSPGAYSIGIVDHLSDRYVLRVEGPGGKPTLFLGIPNQALPGGSHGEVTWTTPSGGVTYLRGWQFPSTPALEFVYPKNDAVAVAKANNSQVPAIDPESEGLVSNTTLSQNEMRIITLWLLTPTRVGPNSPGGIAAARYSQVASAAHKQAVARLPHTAGELPWVALLGSLAAAAAGSLRLRRWSAGRQG